MRFPHHLFLASVLAAIAGGLAPSIAHAGFIGFPPDMSGFTVNQNDSGNAPTMSGGTIHLMNGSHESRSVFYNSPQDISQFTSSFIFQSTSDHYGFSFVLQNSASGANAVAPNDSGDYGYGGFPGKSLAVCLGNDVTGYYTNGSLGSGAVSTSPVILYSGDPIKVTLSYNGSQLQESLLDTTTLASYSTSYLILTPFPTVLGGSTAYVGLVAGDDSYGANQYFSNFQYTASAVPEPSTLALIGFGVIGMLGCAWWRRRAA